MNKELRQVFFTTFAIFFVITVPFLAILSLGYRINFNDSVFENSLSISLNTIPSKSFVKSGEQTFKSPLELKISEGNKPVKLIIESEEFLSEGLVFATSEDRNTAARLQDMWLLPKEKTNDFKPKNDFKIAGFLSENWILLKEGDDLFVQIYGFSGFQGEPIELKNRVEFDESITESNWEFIDKEFFWHPEANLFIFSLAFDNNWQVLDFSEIFDNQIISVTRISPNQILLQDDKGLLWLYNLENNQLDFLWSGVEGLTFTDSPNSIWIFANQNIYKITRDNNTFDPKNFELSDKNLYTENSQLILLNQDFKSGYNNFLAKNVFLGMAFQFENNLIYISDSSKNSFSHLANNIEFLGTDDNSIFWLDSDLNFSSYNLLQKRHFYFANLSEYFSKDFESYSDNIKIYYDQNWKRLMIYGQKKVVSIWFNADVVNSSVIYYRPNSWIDGRTCFYEIIDNYQFCMNSQELTTFKNNSLPWQ